MRDFFSFQSYLWPCVVMIAIVSTGCGTIVQGTRQSVPVQSSPNAVSIDVGGIVYRTPTTLNLERKNEYILKFSKEGYESTQIQLTKHLSGSYLVFDILLGLVGIIIDAATGGWYNLEPESVTVSLSRISSGPGPSEIEIAIKSGEHSGELEIDSSVPEIEIQVIPVR